MVTASSQTWGKGQHFTKPSLQRECLITRPIMGKYCFEGQNLEPLNDSHQWLTLPLDMNYISEH